MTGQWFRAADWWDTAWHRSLNGRTAVCGAIAHLGLPWAPRVPDGQIMCADCED